MKTLAPMFLHTYAIGTKYPMRGFNGGMNGAPNHYVIREGTPEETIVEKTAFEEPLSTGHIVHAKLGGGGGWGDPLERDPAAVLDDVLDEYVSLKSARSNYGVVIDETTMEIDESATAALRKKLAAERHTRQQDQAKAVRYLSPEWQQLCQDALNADPEFARLAGDLTLELNNIIEECPDGKTRFLYWRFENGKLRETEVGPIEQLADRKPFFTTIATYGTFQKINTAKMSADAAVMNGLIRFEGDLVQMMQHAEALERFTEVRRKIPTQY
jgi:putative sterol carrier protein